MMKTAFDLQQMTLAELEKWAIENAMRRTGNNVTAVTRELQMGRTTLYRKLKQYEYENRKAR